MRTLSDAEVYSDPTSINIHASTFIFSIGGVFDIGEVDESKSSGPSSLRIYHYLHPFQLTISLKNFCQLLLCCMDAKPKNTNAFGFIGVLSRSRVPPSVRHW